MKIILRDLFKERKMLSKKIHRIDFHMDLLKKDIEYLKTKIPELNNKTDDEIVAYFIDIFDKCDDAGLNYDEKVDEEMTRIGLRTDFYPGPSHVGKYSNGLYRDDVGNLTSEYEDYLDSQSDNPTPKP